MKYEVFTNTIKTKNKMMSTKRTIFTLMMVLVYVISYAQPKKKGLALDGKTFNIEIYKEGKDKKYDDDVLMFKVGGKLGDKLFGDWGFTGASPYNCTLQDSLSDKKVYIFDCESKPNDKGETLVWNGTITGDDIEGTVEKRKGDKIRSSFTFTGSIKGKKAPGDKTK